MKKFRFGLETVLSYKQQVLDSLQIEHGVIMAQVRQQEELLRQMWQDYYDYSDEYSAKCAVGMEITEVLSSQANLRARERELQQETKVLEDLRKQEEDKRNEVIEAKKDTSSIEKLREKQLDAYQAAEAKMEERNVEEFVSGRSIVAAQANLG